MPHYFHFGQSREMSALHWLLEIRPRPLCEHRNVVEILIQASCRQCWMEACWGDTEAIELCSTLLDRAESPVPVRELLHRCREGDLNAFEQALLRLQQQVEIEVLTSPSPVDLTSDRST